MSEFDREAETRVAVPHDIEVAGSGETCVVAIYTPDPANLGRRYVLNAGVTTVGRDADNDIVLESSNVSRRHARFEERGGHIFLLDEHSTNGTYVNDEPSRVALHQLRRGDQIRVGDTILKFLAGADVEAQYHETIFRFTITDGLTNVGNKKYLSQVLEKEIVRAKRHGRSLSLLMLDIDFFKKVNDTYGHAIGDEVLMAIGDRLSRHLRSFDTVARWGGEEFVVIMPEAEARVAMAVAERLRKKIAEQPVTVRHDVGQLSITVSIGIAVAGDDIQNPDDLLRAADAAMYEAKSQGRDRVVKAEPAPAAKRA